MDYIRDQFDPKPAAGASAGPNDPVTVEWGTGKDRDVYLFAPKVILAVNVALATGRPLLVAGEPGGGKSRLARAVAHVKKWPYYSHTVTSRTQASDLLWTFDALRRLNDANTPRRPLLSTQHYVQPGVIWWGFDPATAAQRGTTALKPRNAWAKDVGVGGSSRAGAVVLVDEIDKADPDVPNDLLEPFDLRRFTVRDTNDVITSARDVFLMMTTNRERDLPPAFVRRCVLLVLDDPKDDWFERVAARHFPGGDAALHKEVAAEVMRLRGDAEKKQLRKPSTAEFLDAVIVCEKLKLRPNTPAWNDIVRSTLLKSDRLADGQG